MVRALGSSVAVAALASHSRLVMHTQYSGDPAPDGRQDGGKKPGPEIAMPSASGRRLLPPIRRSHEVCVTVTGRAIEVET
jgi:hypothetical protein